MGRPVTLFTGQWADMPLENLARKAREFGYQGLEIILKLTRQSLMTAIAQRSETCLNSTT